MAQPGQLPKNTQDGKWIATVRALGRVPPCVRDAFSWLPHPWGKKGRKKSEPLVWFWVMHGGEPPEPREPSGDRCQRCIFQEPVWSQGYAACSHSWLKDDDGDCRAFFGRDEFVAKVGDQARTFCVPPRIVSQSTGGEPVDQLLASPYWADGTLYPDIVPSCNVPSFYHARLNLPGFYSYFAAVYAAVDRERWRRFWQWAERVTIEQTGIYQPDMFLGL